VCEFAQFLGALAPIRRIILLRLTGHPIRRASLRAFRLVWLVVATTAQPSLRICPGGKPLGLPLRGRRIRRHAAGDTQLEGRPLLSKYWAFARYHPVHWSQQICGAPIEMSGQRMAATLRLRCAVSRHNRTMPPNVPLASACFQISRISASSRMRARACAPGLDRADERDPLQCSERRAVSAVYGHFEPSSSKPLRLL
jgi:hypothetical protein